MRMFFLLGVLGALSAAYAQGARAGEPTVVGGMDKALLQKTVRAHESTLSACKSAGAGTVVIQFVIGANGKVTTASPRDNTTGNASLADCVAGRIRTWVFPKPKGGGIVSVTYPFAFNAEAGAAPANAPGANAASASGPKPGDPALVSVSDVGQNGVNNGDVAGVFQAHRAALRGCFDAAFGPKAKSARTVELSISLQSSGAPSAVGVSDEEEQISEKFNRCLEEEVRRWTFPAPDDMPASVSGTLKFKPPRR